MYFSCLTAHFAMSIIVNSGPIVIDTPSANAITNTVSSACVDLICFAPAFQTILSMDDQQAARLLHALP